MVEIIPTAARSVNSRSKMFYWIVLLINVIFGIGHAAYTFMEYTALEEPALWFFSGALAVLFNTGLNVIYATESNKRYFLITLISNTTLLAFGIVLALVIKEPQAIGFALTMLLTLLAGIVRQLHVSQR